MENVSIPPKAEGSPTFVVVSKCARMPASCWGRYKRVAVVEVIDPTKDVPAIDVRGRNVVRIVRTWEALNVGHTDRCAYAKALAEAQTVADELNAAACKGACAMETCHFDIEQHRARLSTLGVFWYVLFKELERTEPEDSEATLAINALQYVLWRRAQADEGLAPLQETFRALFDGIKE